MAIEISNENLIKNCYQTLSILAELKKDSVVDSSKVVSDAVSALLKSFDLTDGQKESIVKVLNKSKLVASTEKLDMDIGDIFLLRGLLHKSGIRFDKTRVDFDKNLVDLDYLTGVIKKVKDKAEKAIRKEMLQSAINRLTLAKKAVNAANLASEAQIEVADAEKYLKQLEVIAVSINFKKKYKDAIDALTASGKEITPANFAKEAGISLEDAGKQLTKIIDKENKRLNKLNK